MAKKKYYYAAYSYTDKEGRFTKATMTGITTGDGKIVSGIIKCAAKRLDGYADSRTIQVDNVIEMSEADYNELEAWNRVVHPEDPIDSYKGDDPIEDYLPADDKVKEERKHPIFEDYESNENGETKQLFMLSLNGMYSSGITHEQLKELAEATALELHPEAKKMADDANQK